ncbi:MAG: circularly permuted type 2 ATP-grasp protein [Pseudomonadota bacterium]|nr:circularly permuted type 2 ATP-grasp protein [Pseudomonadota bacterium]
MRASVRWEQAVRATPSSAADFLGRVSAAGARFGDAPVCVHRTPMFLDRAALRRWARILPRFHRIVRHARAALLADLDREHESLAARIGVDAQSIAWARVDPGFASAAPLARVDAFSADGHPWFVELNAESPAGMGYADALAGVFAEDPAWTATGSLRAFDVRGALVRTVREIAREWGHRHRRLTVAIVDRAGVPTEPEFTLIRDRFRAAGLVAEVVHPDQLRFDGDALTAGDLRIDVVFRRVLVADLRAHPEDGAALLAAYRARRVCMVNSLRTALLHCKGLFALFHDPAFALSEADRAFVERHIPWTGLLLGDAGDALRERALHEPDAWVLKPLDGYGGQGVVLGWASDARAWARAVSEADRHVLQRRLPEARGAFFDVRAGEPRDRLIDLGPFLARGRLAGFLCRVAEGPLANVTCGASQVPVFIDLAS